jgi:hypothetical protein
MSITSIRRQRGDIDRLPILDPTDRRAPEWMRQRYAGRRCVVWLEGPGLEGSIVAGGPEPPRADARPTSRFTYTPANPRAGDEVTFDAMSAIGQIDTYEWLEVGSNQQAEGHIVRFTFLTPGRRAMLLTVTGPGGRHQGGQHVDIAEA